MATETDNTAKTIRNVAPCLPSSAMLPTLTNLIQGENINRPGTVNYQGFDTKKSKQFRIPENSSDNESRLRRLHCFACACVSRHRKDSLDISPISEDNRPLQEKNQNSSTIEQTVESSNNNILTESNPIECSAEDQVSPKSKDVGKHQNPFIRIRSYFSKRRRKLESTISDREVSTADCSSNGCSDSTHPSPKIENDLMEKVFNFPFTLSSLY